MGEADEPGPITEPLVTPDSFATGVEVEPVDGVVRIVAWAEISGTDGAAGERRIVSRLVLPAETARQLVVDLRKTLARGGN